MFVPDVISHSYTKNFTQVRKSELYTKPPKRYMEQIEKLRKLKKDHIDFVNKNKTT